MKRDVNIIRQILLNVEDNKPPLGGTVRLAGIPDEVCAYHCALIFDAGLAKGTLIRSDCSGIVGATIERLSSAGHDFCDGIRQDTIWNKALKRFIKPSASYGLSVLIECVKIELRQQVFGSSSS